MLDQGGELEERGIWKIDCVYPYVPSANPGCAPKLIGCIQRSRAEIGNLSRSTYIRTVRFVFRQSKYQKKYVLNRNGSHEYGEQLMFDALE